MATVRGLICLGSETTADGDCSHDSKRHLPRGREAWTNLESMLKSRDIIALSSQSCAFSSSHVRMSGLDCQESWAAENWCFWTVVLEKARASSLACKAIQPVRPTRSKFWIFTGRTEAEAETPTLWPPDAKNWLPGQGPDAGKDRRLEEKGMTEHEMVGWHHRLDGPEFEQGPGVGDGQGSFAFCSKWVCKEANTTERLNWFDNITAGIHGLASCEQARSVSEWRPERRWKWYN